MPELPEVETIRRSLVKKVTGQRINRVGIRKNSRLLRDTVSPATLKKRLTGKKIKTIGRRGKYLVFTLDSGDFLVVHLGMSGVIYTADLDRKKPAHTHLRLDLDDRAIILIDPRTFGRIFFIRAGGLDSHPALGRLGIEPLSHGFTAKKLGALLCRRKATLKAVLLNQSVVAGIGNIYADEACFRARVSPLRRADSLCASEIKALTLSIRAVLKKSIAAKGTTIRDYRWEAGRSGDFVRQLKVYSKEGKTCPRCANKIKRDIVVGRSTFFCPECQG